MIGVPRCYERACKHFLGVASDDGGEETERVVCSAYPDAIPLEIAFGADLHLTPRPGDRGIQYEEDPEEAERLSLLANVDPYHDETGRFATADSAASKAGEAGASAAGRFETVKDWRQSLNNRQRRVIRAWTYDAYVDIRKVDKGETLDDPELHKAAVRDRDLLYAAMERAPVSTKAVYRGLANIPEADALKHFGQGAVVRLDAISSFTRDKGIAKYFVEHMGVKQMPGHVGVMLKVEGAGSHDIKSFSETPEEMEHVMLKGATLRVKSMVRDGDVLHVTMGPHE
jgi:hypothetical protein